MKNNSPQSTTTPPAASANPSPTPDPNQPGDVTRKVERVLGELAEDALEGLEKDAETTLADSAAGRTGSK